MNPNNTANPKINTINIAIDVDLTLLDTLTPWLDAYQVDINDIPNNDSEVWSDLAVWLDENGTPNPKYKKSYEYWNDPLIYIDAQLNPGVMYFLDSLKNHIQETSIYKVNFFICSTCTVAHKMAKILRIKELCEDFFNGFVDTSDKHLVDYDILIDDSPNQNLQSAIAGKYSLLVPTPMNNVVELIEQYRKSEAIGAIWALGDNYLKDDNSLDSMSTTKYNGFWEHFGSLDNTTKEDLLNEITLQAIRTKQGKY